MSTWMPCSARRSATAAMYTFIPPESPIPGWSAGEVCKLIMASRSGPVEGSGEEGSTGCSACSRMRNSMLEGGSDSETRKPAPEGESSRFHRNGSGLADLLGGLLGGLGRGAGGLADAGGRGLDLRPGRLGLVDGPLGVRGPADLAG